MSLLCSAWSLVLTHENGTGVNATHHTIAFNRCAEDTIASTLLAVSVCVILLVALAQRKCMAAILAEASEDDRTDLSQPVGSAKAMRLFRQLRYDEHEAASAAVSAAAVGPPAGSTSIGSTSIATRASLCSSAFAALCVCALSLSVALAVGSALRAFSIGVDTVVFSCEAIANGGAGTWARLLWADVASLLQWVVFCAVVLPQFASAIAARLAGPPQSAADSPLILPPISPLFAVRGWAVVKAVFVLLRARVQIVIVLGNAIPAVHTWMSYDAAHDADADEAVSASWMTNLRLARAALVTILSIVALVMPGRGGDEAGNNNDTFDPLTLLTYDEATKTWSFVGEATDDSEKRMTPAEEDAAIAAQASAEKSSSLVSYFTFGWLGSLLRAGLRAPLQLKQIFMYVGEDGPAVNAEMVGGSLSRRMGRRADKGAGACTLCCALQRDYFWYIWGNGLLVLLGALLSLAQPQLLGMFLKQIEAGRGDGRSEWEVWSIGGLLVGVQIVTAIIVTPQTSWVAARLGMRARGALSVLVFNKAMRIGLPVQSEVGIGKIVNMMEQDCMQLANSLLSIHTVWKVPMLMAVGMTLLYNLVGPAAFGALGVMIAVNCVQSVVVPFLFKGFYAIKKLTDARVKLLTEFLNGIRIIKLLTWEKKMLAIIEHKRRLEVMQLIRVRIILYGFVVPLMWFTPILINIVTFVIYYKTSGKRLTASIAYPTLAFTALLQSALMQLPLALSQFAQVVTGIKRISEFISRPEVTARHVIEDGDEVPTGEERAGYCRVYTAPRRDPTGAPVVLIESADFDWTWGGSNKEEEKKKADETEETTGETGEDAAAASLSAPLLGADSLAETGADGVAIVDSVAAAEATPKSVEQAESGGVSDVSLVVPRGAFVCIVGKVGSGKSTVLHSIINEVPIKRGYVEVRARAVAYCAQEAWVQTCSVRENILFGRPFIEERYKHAIDAACLWKDLEQLRDGDDTEVGERGFTLSGGQQQRIAFARAVYSNADLYVLDDVLSAVDPEVCNLIIQNGLLGALKKTTRVLVTNAMHVLPQADLVVVVDNGKIHAVGKYEQLLSSGIDLLNHVTVASTTSTSEEGTAAAASGSPPPSPGTRGPLDGEPMLVRRQDTPSSGFGNNRAARAAAVESEEGTPKDCTPKEGAEEEGADETTGAGTFKLVGDEDRQVGVVSPAVWGKLLIAAGWWLTLPVVILYWAGSVLQQGSSAWLKVWVEDATAPYLHTEYYYIFTFTGISLVVVGMIFVRTLTKTFASARLSLTVHTQALEKVFHAPMSWFEATKVGRLINRFSSDLGKLDWAVLDNVMGFIWMLSTAATMVILVVVYSWYSLLVFAPLTAFYYIMQRLYRASAREAQRVASISRSPVFDSFNEMLSGVTTVRGFGAQVVFAEKNVRRLQKNVSANMNLQSMSVWLSIRLNMITTIAMIEMIIIINIQHQFGLNLGDLASIISGHGVDHSATQTSDSSAAAAIAGTAVTGGLVGLVLQTVIGLAGTLAGIITSFTTAETSLVSMERLLAFKDTPGEEDLVGLLVDGAAEGTAAVAGVRVPKKRGSLQGGEMGDMAAAVIPTDIDVNWPRTGTFVVCVFVCVFALEQHVRVRVRALSFSRAFSLSTTLTAIL